MKKTKRIHSRLTRKPKNWKYHQPTALMPYARIDRSNQLTPPVSARFTRAEHKKLWRAAAKANLTKSAYVHNAVMHAVSITFRDCH